MQATYIFTTCYLNIRCVIYSDSSSILLLLCCISRICSIFRNEKNQTRGTDMSPTRPAEAASSPASFYLVMSGIRYLHITKLYGAAKM